MYYFIFSYYAAGINFVDLAQLEWDNVEGSDLVYTRRKTSELLRVPLMKEALKILKEYRVNHTSNQGVNTREKYNSESNSQPPTDKICKPYVNRMICKKPQIALRP